jgi:hypothetical protein
MDIRNLLKEMGNQTGLGDIVLDENNVCRLVFDDRLAVDVEALPDGKKFYIHASVGLTPYENRATFFEELLAANLFGQGTAGATLALDRDLGEIILFREFETEKTDYQEFVSALEVFLSRLEYWTERVSSGEAGTTEEGPGDRRREETPHEGPMIRV